MKLIAFTGLAQSGKSTASVYLENTHGFTRVNFKSAMIEEIKRLMPDFLKKEAEIHNCTIDELFNTKPGSFRQFMQNYGTELRRGEDNDYWVDKWKWLVGCAAVNNIVVDDLRFINESKAISNNKGIIIRVVKKGQENTMLHQSEIEMNDIIPDETIEVEPGDLEGLYKKLDKYVHDPARHSE